MTISNIYQWLNKEKSRYYTITIDAEGTNAIVINYRWGSYHTNRGGRKNLLVQSSEEAQSIITNMMKRRKTRGYELIANATLFP